MKRLLQRLKRPWGKRNKAASLPDASLRLAPQAPDWRHDHQGTWNQFLATDAGYVLMARLRAVEAQVATNACKDFMHPAHSAGTANGWNECRLWLESLSRSSRVNEPSGQEDNLATDMPRPGEAALHELLSP